MAEPGSGRDLSPRLRLIVSLCKSGSTALIHSLSHARGVQCYLQTVKSGQRMHGLPDYGIFYQRHEGIALSKETIGHSTPEDCTLRIFPSDEAIAATAPVFLLRDPVDTWASWSRAGWGTLELFELAYGHALALCDRAQGLSPRAAAMAYEDFGRDCEAAFRRLCRILEIGYHPDMVHWRLRFPDDSPVIWREDVQRDFERGQADRVRAAEGFVYRRTDCALPAHEEARINRLFRAAYESATR
jgi:hypothetical protein